MFRVKEWKKPFLPKIVAIDPDIWLTKPTENDNEDLKWFFNQTCDAWKLQDWWDDHSPFVYHMVSIAIKVGMMSRKEINEIYEEKKEK